MWPWRSNDPTSHFEQNAFTVGLGASVGLACLLAVGMPPGRAEEETAPSEPVMDKTAEGLHFKVPPDWPIEKRGGVMAPIPIEEYLARRFQGLDARWQSVEQRLSVLDRRLRAVEEALEQQRQAAPPAGGGASP